MIFGQIELNSAHRTYKGFCENCKFIQQLTNVRTFANSLQCTLVQKMFLNVEKTNNCPSVLFFRKITLK